MGKRKELSLDEKVSLVEECLTGRLRMREAARRAGVGHSTMESWISRYRSEGISALEENGNQSKRRYDEDFKRKVVKAYMSGQGSSMAIAEMWGDRIFEKCGIGRDEGGDDGKTLEMRGKRRLSARDGGANYQQS